MYITYYAHNENKQQAKSYSIMQKWLSIVGDYHVSSKRVNAYITQLVFFDVNIPQFYNNDDDNDDMYVSLYKQYLLYSPTNSQ